MDGKALDVNTLLLLAGLGLNGAYFIGRWMRTREVQDRASGTAVTRLEHEIQRLHEKASEHGTKLQQQFTEHGAEMRHQFTEIERRLAKLEARRS